MIEELKSWKGEWLDLLTDRLDGLIIKPHQFGLIPFDSKFLESNKLNKYHFQLSGIISKPFNENKFIKLLEVISDNIAIQINLFIADNIKNIHQYIFLEESYLSYISHIKKRTYGLYTSKHKGIHLYISFHNESDSYSLITINASLGVINTIDLGNGEDNG